jgi:hypothetical protein
MTNSDNGLWNFVKSIQIIFYFINSVQATAIMLSLKIFLPLYL